MKIRYAIEKEIEVTDDYSDEMIDDIIKAKEGDSDDCRTKICERRLVG